MIRISSFGCLKIALFDEVVRELLADPETEMYCSAISIAEISIKHQIHPNEMILSGEEMSEVVPKLGCKNLAFKIQHVATLDKLPLYHRDPFDRMLLAQAKAEGMKILSHDSRFSAYGDFVISI